MAKGRKTGGRDFVKGDPRAGRPKGIVEKHPRGLLKSIIVRLIEEDERTLRDTLRKNLKDKDRAIRLVELAAKLNKEIGVEATTAPTQVIINYHGPLDPKRFRAKTERHLRSQEEEEPVLETG